MKSFIVTKIQWASYGDMALPFYAMEQAEQTPKRFLAAHLGISVCNASYSV